jgi:hypothetical protein
MVVVVEVVASLTMVSCRPRPVMMEAIEEVSGRVVVVVLVEAAIVLSTRGVAVILRQK